MKKNNMLSGSPGKTLLTFAIPMMIGNLFQQFYNLVDSAVVGKYVGENALAAVGASYATPMSSSPSLLAAESEVL